MRGDGRLTTILDAAIAVFLRFGFRKTSMDEVAKAAHLSRQGLYLHFATKEELFRAAVEHALETSLAAAAAALGNGSLSLEAKLTAAFDEWLGKYVGIASGSASDLAEANGGELVTLFSAYEAQFLEALTKTLRTSGLPAAYKHASLSAKQLAATLYATGRGLKHSAESRKAFADGITIAVRVLCFPLRDAV